MSSYQLPEDQDYIEVQYPYDSQDEWDDASYLSTPRQSKLAPPSAHSGKSRSKRKGSKTATTTQSGSDTEKEPPTMSSRPSRHSSSGSGSSSRKDKSSSSKTKKTDDWTDVTEPDERRRIQNRIAQRKFREKAREQKDRAARDAQNQQYAGSAYHIPSADDLALDDGDDAGDLSGLPWGGLNMRHVVARGHHHASTTGTSHSHSHHSGSSSGGGGGGIMHTPGPAPVDQALYQMNPYGYAAQPMESGVGDVYGGHGGYDAHVQHHASPYAAGGYYDFDAGAAGDGSHGM